MEEHIPRRRPREHFPRSLIYGPFVFLSLGIALKFLLPWILEAGINADKIGKAMLTFLNGTKQMAIAVLAFVDRYSVLLAIISLGLGIFSILQARSGSKQTSRIIRQSQMMLGQINEVLLSLQGISKGQEALSLSLRDIKKTVSTNTSNSPPQQGKSQSFADGFDDYT